MTAIHKLGASGCRKHLSLPTTYHPEVPSILPHSSIASSLLTHPLLSSLPTRLGPQALAVDHKQTLPLIWVFQTGLFGTSVVVQWPRLCAPNAGALGSIPDPGTKPYVLQRKGSHAVAKDQEPQAAMKIEDPTCRHPVQPNKY